MSNMLGSIKESALKILEIFGPLASFFHPDIAGPIKDFLEKLSGGSSDFWWESFKRFLRREDPFTVLMDTANQLSRWKRIYKHATGVTIDWSELLIPVRPEGFDRLIIVGRGLTINRVVESLSSKFEIQSYSQDLDSEISENDRTSHGCTYAIWVRDRVEADIENSGLSADDCVKRMDGQTLLERLLHELVYLVETGNHLDIVSDTICSGSLNPDGTVPIVGWRSKLHISWIPSGAHRFEKARARTVVC